MCRLLGIVASEPTEFRIVLKEAPRSLATLSLEHRDGWGLAIYEDLGAPGWRLHKGVMCASEDENFHRLAVGSRGEVMVAHVRQRTVGSSSLPNTHPFQSGQWVFAHNGTIKDQPFLRARTSPARLSELRGETDSELLFAFLLTRMDAAAVSDAPVGPATDVAIRDAVREMRGNAALGSYNFILSDGSSSYAHRFGRTLFLLERGPEDAVRPRRESREGVVVETPWSQRRRAVFVASERLTDEPWEEVAEGILLRVDRRPLPSWRLVDARAA
jgi:predicted glutamine amidotransferase